MENEYIKYWQYNLKMNKQFLRHNEENLRLVTEQLALLSNSKSDLIKKMYGDKADIEKLKVQLEGNVKAFKQSIDFAEAQLEMYNLSKGKYLTDFNKLIN